MTTVTITTYTPDGDLFVTGETVIKRLLFGTVAATVERRVARGWIATSDKQVAKLDKIGFLDVVSYSEEIGRDESQRIN